MNMFKRDICDSEDFTIKKNSLQKKTELNADRKSVV